MEPLSQALLGASVGYGVAGRTLGRRALGWGALLGMLPDLDVLLGGVDEGFGEMLYHRGSTHALWFGPLIGPVLGALLWRAFGRGTPRRAWQKLAVLALVTHPLLDVFTPYGTQLFAPFWRARIAFDGIGIVDPFYTAPLLIGVLLAVTVAPARKHSKRNVLVDVGNAQANAANKKSQFDVGETAPLADGKSARDRRHIFARRACLAGLAVGTLYLCAGVGLNEWARADARRVLAATHTQQTSRVTDAATTLAQQTPHAADATTTHAQQTPHAAPASQLAHIEVYPTLLQPFMRRVTATDARGRFSGWHTAWKPGCLYGARFEEVVDARLDALRATPRGQLFVWYARGDVTGRVTTRADGSAHATLEDLRYASPSAPPHHGMWGVRADFDARGQQVGRAERFYRREISRGAAADVWRTLWQMTRGDFSSTAAKTFGDPSRCD